MPSLPALNTQGIDITGALQAVEGMKYNQMRQANLASQIAARDAEKPFLNTLRVAQQKKAMAEAVKDEQAVQKENMSLISKSLRYIGGLPEESQAAALDDFSTSMVNKFKATGGKQGLDPSLSVSSKLFMSPEGKWDSAKYNAYATSADRAIRGVENPKEGERVDIPMANPDFDSTKEESADNPSMVKASFTTQNGKLVPISNPNFNEELPVSMRNSQVLIQPMLDVFTKEKREQKRATETERHNKEMEKIGLKQASASERRAAAIEGREGRLSSADQKENWTYIADTESGDKVLMDTKTGNTKVVKPGAGQKFKPKPKAEDTALKEVLDKDKKGTGSAVDNKYLTTATNPNTGRQIGSNDGKAWFDLQTGERVQ